MRNKILTLFLFALFLSLQSASAPKTSVIELPTMGWSSWNTYRINISDSLIMQQADAMVAQGLKDVGYTYVNIDDGFFGGRDSLSGRLKIHPERFPQGLKPVVKYIHKLGLKAGIYTDAGTNTCGHWYDNDSIAEGVGLYGHDQQDCDMFFCEMGFDFIKIDFCGGTPNRNVQHQDLDPQERYTAIRQAIMNTGRPDVRMNVCRWDYPGTWVSHVASSWRISRDISPRWNVVKEIINQNLYLSAYAGGGHYNDMDMLEVGRSLSAEEDHTHFAMWCMMSSPLLIGCDMTKLKPHTLALLKNRDLIAINQDQLGLQAYVAKHDAQTGTFVLVKDLLEQNGNTRAVAFYNPTDEPHTISISPADIQLSGKIQARNLYNDSLRHSIQVLRSDDSLTLQVPAHGCRVCLLTAERRLPRVCYEAETAYLSCYQELENPLAVGSAYYAVDSLCSGSMKVTNLGGRVENDLQWRDVWCQEDGAYEIKIRLASSLQDSVLAEDKSLKMSVNGNDVAPDTPCALRKGMNTIRLYSDAGKMPDIDYMEVCPVR